MWARAICERKSLINVGFFIRDLAIGGSGADFQLHGVKIEQHFSRAEKKCVEFSMDPGTVCGRGIRVGCKQWQAGDEL